MGTPLGFLDGGGEVAGRIRARDWSGHPLGPPETWPEALRTALSLILNSPESMILAWGPDLHFFHNDAYAPLLGPRAAWAVGARFDEVWADAWVQAKPIIDEAMAGRSRRFVDLPWKLDTDRGSADTWWSFSYSRVLDAEGRPAGLFIFTNETTERVLADRRTELMVERQKNSLQQMPGFAAVLAGPEHVFTYVNDAYIAMAGRRDYLGRSVRDVFPDIAGQGFYELLDQAYLTGTPFTARGLPVDLAAGARVVDLLYQPVRDDHGKVSGLFVGGYDVTEAHRTSAALADSEARYRTLFNSVDEAFCIIEFVDGPNGPLTDYVLVEANDAFERHSGIPDGVGHRVSELVPDEYEGWVALYGEVLRTGRSIRFERTLEATGRFLELAAVRIDPAERRQVAVLFQDITARKRAETELRELNETLESQVEARTQERDRMWRLSRDLFVIVGRDGACKAANPTWERELGHAPDALLGAAFESLVEPDDRGEVRGCFEELLAGAPTVTFDCRMARADGEHRLITWTGVATDTGVYCTGRDITDQRRTEEALRQAQKMEAVGQLTGGLAHDFNNLLAGVSGALELIGTRVAQGRAGEVERYVDVAQGAARRAASLTHRLLAFSRRQTLDPRPTDANVLVAGMEELIRRTVGPAVTVEVVRASGLWPTLVDPPQLENALLNLCINARDAMPEGGRLTIETANSWLDATTARVHDLSPGQYVSLSVTDTGVGMAPDVIAKAFDPFFTTKPIGEGTGLGLSMIYGFAKQSGGQVRIYSEVGQGTTLRLHLPRHLGEAEPVDALAPLSAPPRAEAGETVLVVDDEPTVRLLVTEVLQDLGYAALEASDSAAGLRVLQSDARIDLLITDVGLPGGMNGRQMVDAARGRRADLKVLFITGYAENAVLNGGRLEPGMAVMTKPFVIETLAARIREMIARPR